MDVYTHRDLPHVRATIRERLLRGEIAILPTDTIYGLSGNALDPRVVARILRIKRRRRPVSFVPHSLDWARLLVAERKRALFDEVVETYRGRFTTLWPFAGGAASVPRALTSSGLVGLRLPEHWIRDVAEETGLPLITTSVNETRAPYMTTLDDLAREIRGHVDFIVYEGSLEGPPSTIVRTDGRRPFAQEAR